jgi:hypothetical protein
MITDASLHWISVTLWMVAALDGIVELLLLNNGYPGAATLNLLGVVILIVGLT